MNDLLPYSDGAEIAIIGSPLGGFSANGKVTPELFFPKFAYELSKQDMSVVVYGDVECFLENRGQDSTKTVVILIYNEEVVKNSGGLTGNIDEMALAAKLEENKNILVYNTVTLGSIIGDKEQTNRLFEDAGVLVPPMVSNGGSGDDKVFSIDTHGSGRENFVVQEFDKIDCSRHNTKLVNTLYEYKGKSYYVCLRVLVVGGSMVTAYPRLRLATENNPNVHNADTPLDIDAIRYFKVDFVDKMEAEIADLCSSAGAALGSGFFAHDILPCSETGKLYICETGFKFDDMSYRERLWPISSDLPFLAEHFNIDIAGIAAKAFVKESRKHGFL